MLLWADDMKNLRQSLKRKKKKVNERKARYLKMQNILKILERSDSVLEIFDENVWNTVVENITVFHDGCMVFLFKDGSEIKIWIGMMMPSVVWWLLRALFEKEYVQP